MFRSVLIVLTLGMLAAACAPTPMTVMQDARLLPPGEAETTPYASTMTLVKHSTMGYNVYPGFELGVHGSRGFDNFELHGSVQVFGNGFIGAAGELGAKFSVVDDAVSVYLPLQYAFSQLHCMTCVMFNPTLLTRIPIQDGVSIHPFVRAVIPFGIDHGPQPVAGLSARFRVGSVVLIPEISGLVFVRGFEFRGAYAANFALGLSLMD